MDPVPPLFRFPVPDATVSDDDCCYQNQTKNDHGSRYVACSSGDSDNSMDGVGPNVPEPIFSSDPYLVDEILSTFLRSPSSPSATATAAAVAISPSTFSLSPPSLVDGSQIALVEPPPFIGSFRTTTGGSGTAGIEHRLGPQNHHQHTTSVTLDGASGGMRRRISSMSSSTRSSTSIHYLHHQQNHTFKLHTASEPIPSLVSSDPSTGPSSTSLMPTPPSVSPTEMSMTEANFKQDSSPRRSSDSRHHRDRDDGRWMRHFKQLQGFKGRHGHSHVPVYFKENPSLSRWAKRQRYQYKLMIERKRSTLTPFRQRLLEDLGFVWNIRRNVWDERYDELVNFNTVHGHCNVPLKFTASPKLGTWVKCQRRQYALMMKDQPSNMTHERVERLNRLGFKWYGGGGSIVATEKSLGRVTSSEVKETNETPNPEMVSSAAQTGTAVSTPNEDALQDDENDLLLFNIEPEALDCISNDDEEGQHQHVDDFLLENLHEFVRFTTPDDVGSFENIQDKTVGQHSRQ